VSLLDVIFGSVGVFIAIIVIQSAMVRPEDRPAEADLYAVLLDGGTVLDAVADTSVWRRAGRAGDSAELKIDAWLERIVGLSLAGQRIVKIEIAHGPDTVPLRLDLEKRLNDLVGEGVGAGRAPPFTVVWRPLAADADRRAWPRERAFMEAHGE
jgi:hypothetical protein